MKKFLFILCFIGVVSCNQNKKSEGLSKLATEVRPEFLFGTSLKQDRDWNGTHDMWTKIEEIDAYEQILLDNFNCAAIVIFHNRLQFKPDGKYHFEESGVNYRINWAYEHGLPVYLQPLTGPDIYNPDWLVNGNYSSPQLDSILQNHIKTIVGTYRDKISYLEVVNEAIAWGDGWSTDHNVWLNMGWKEENGKRWPVFFERAFRLARQFATDSTQLIYNDNNNAMLESPKADMTYEIVKLVKEQNIPVDGVGLQFHAGVKDGTLYEGGKANGVEVDFNSFAKNMQRLADLGIDIHITEFDVHLPENPTQADYELQAYAYKEVVKRCLEQPACKSFKTWNFIDKYSWSAFGEYNEQPQLFDTLLHPKKAYFEVKKYLKNEKKYLESRNISRDTNQFYPRASFIDITKPPYNADNTGQTDISEAYINAIIDASESNRFLYFPSGTYLVEKSLCKFNTTRKLKGNDQIGHRDIAAQRIIGENKSTTIIKLKDYAFDSRKIAAIDFISPKGWGQPWSYTNEIRNLTIDVGKGNPEATGIIFNGCNTAVIDNILIKSSDPEKKGSIGLDLTLAHGPAYFKNIEVDGFDVGIKINQDVSNYILEHITLKNQRVAGLQNLNSIIQVRKLISYNSVPAIQNVGDDNGYEGFITLIDSEFNQGGKFNYAIENKKGFLLALDLKSNGYKGIINDRGNKDTSNLTSFYSSHGIINSENTPKKPLKLPVKEIPSPPDLKENDWASVKDFGAKGDSLTDDTKALQAAFNSGKKGIYFEPGYYVISNTINIGNNLQQIDFFWAKLVPKAPLVDENNPENAMFRLIDGKSNRVFINRAWVTLFQEGSFTFINHASTRDLVLKDLHLHRGAAYRNSVEGGRVFIESVKAKARPRKPGFSAFHFKGQTVWARQINPEDGEFLIVNDNSFLWVLGIKTEIHVPVIKTINSGQSEILGGLIWVNENNEYTEYPGQTPMVVCNNSHCSISLVEFPKGSEKIAHNILVKDKKGNTTTEYIKELFPQRKYKNWDITGYGSVLPLFVSYDTTAIDLEKWGIEEKQATP